MADDSRRKRRGRGEGGVHFDDHRQLWVGSVSLGYHPDGRRNRPTVYRHSKREVLTELDRLRREAGKAPQSALTVAELLELWLDAQRGRLAEHTVEGRERASAAVAAALGARPVATLTALDVSRFHAAMRKDAMAPSAAWHAARALAGALAHAVTLGVLTASPAADVPLPGMPEREMVVLSPTQAKELLNAARGHVAYPLVAVALGTGVRQGELLGLGWEHLDLDAGTLSVRRQLTRTKGSGFALRKVKTRASRRTLCLPGFAVEALRELLASREWQPTWTVFCGPGGSHRHRGQLSTHLKKTIRRANRAGAGIPEGLTWHALRHSHASLLLSAGHSLRAVSARLGHANPTTTLRLYAHLMPGDDQRLAEGIQGILG
jgi:integrase